MLIGWVDQVGEGRFEPVGNLGVVRDQWKVRRNGGEDRRDEIAGHRAIRVELDDGLDAGGFQRQFLPRFADGGLRRRFAGVDPPAGKSDLSGVGAKVVPPHRQDHSRLGPVRDRDQHRRLLVRLLLARGDVAGEEPACGLEPLAELIGQFHGRQLSSLVRRRNDDAHE